MGFRLLAKLWVMVSTGLRRWPVLRSPLNRLRYRLPRRRPAGCPVDRHANSPTDSLADGQTTVILTPLPTAVLTVQLSAMLATLPTALPTALLARSATVAGAAA